jgi:hypothetical protein
MRQFRTSTDSVFDLDTALEHPEDHRAEHAAQAAVVVQAGPPAQESTAPRPRGA